MSITVRYFASLAETIGYSEKNLEYVEQMSVKTVWDKAAPGEVLATNVLCAVNMEYADWDAAVKDGDEVAFFPPVTGG